MEEKTSTEFNFTGCSIAQNRQRDRQETEGKKIHKQMILYRIYSNLIIWRWKQQTFQKTKKEKTEKRVEKAEEKTKQWKV